MISATLCLRKDENGQAVMTNDMCAEWTEDVVGASVATMMLKGKSVHVVVYETPVSRFIHLVDGDCECDHCDDWRFIVAIKGQTN